MSASSMTHDAYTVAWICALPLEAAAATAMLDKIHPSLSQPEGDNNTYTLGEIAGHKVVIVCLPSGVYGTVSAATVAGQMRSTFHSLRFGLMVGIGGGVPGANHDIRLGDIVVSKPTDVFSGVVQYDYGKTVSDGRFRQTGMMNQPPQILLNAISRVQTEELLGGRQGLSEVISDTLLNMSAELKARCSRPSQEHDVLFDASYDHPETEDTCISCNKRHLVQRAPRTSDKPEIHYGLIASGNQVMKHGKTRDRLAKEHDILCFEMEAAGLMNQLPCLVIRGICDYSDSHKNEQWQGYAALGAAAYTKVLLAVVPVNQPRQNQAPQKSSWMVPFERNPRFVGRHDQVNRLIDAILSKDRTRKMAISGLGGMGKTQVALEVAYEIREKEPDRSVFWIPATSVETVEQGFMNISEHSGLQDVTPMNAKFRVKEFLSSEEAGPWLLIIDNADDNDMWMNIGDSSPALKSCIPHSKNGFVLFTTRNQQLAIKLVGPEIIKLLEMGEDMAADLLRMSLIRKDLVDDDDAFRLLLHELSCLPLAIIQAANYINETETSLSTYLSLLRNQETVMVELLSQDFEDEWRYADINNPVAATWLVSFQHIQKLNSLATDYLSFMSCIDPRDIPLSLLPPTDSPIKQRNALGLLKAYSFVTGQSNDQSVSLHRLVHLATRNWLRNNGSLEKWLVDTGKRLEDIFPFASYENRMLWREYLPHAQFLLQSKEFHKHTRWRQELSHKVGKCLYRDSRFTEAYALFKPVADERLNEYGKDHYKTLSSLFWVANTYRRQKQWAEAEDLEVQMINICRTMFGPGDLTTLARMNNLAGIYRREGRFLEAEKLGIEALKICEAELEPGGSITLTTMASLAATYGCLRRWADAVRLQVHVVQTSKRVRGAGHLGTLVAMSDLGYLYLDQGRLVEAENTFLQALKLYKVSPGPLHPEALKTMNNLAATYWNQGRRVEAANMEIEALEASKATLGPEHPDTFNRLRFISNIFQRLNRHSEALSMSEAYVRMRQEVSGPDHPDTLAAIAELERYKNYLRHLQSPSPVGGDRDSNPAPAEISSERLSSANQQDIRRPESGVFSEPLLLAGLKQAGRKSSKIESEDNDDDVD
ncbi:hypothetical protein AJ79_01838 [Helicocarpus griseus UAMH5409]|uniref:Uncharacterized protein n=1 Tax=Helicocarpus griseus UAMH5409 TaxID=1447875 RepID=A0A2B7Y591_9EURO|nr:hypothetical protein AJ79_01838 [Helicocarpus griseus UAMH5409]